MPHNQASFWRYEQNQYEYWQGYFAAQRGALSCGYRSVAWRDGYEAFKRGVSNG
jgi:hypothetical protein